VIEAESLRTWYAHPLVNALSVLIGVVGVLLAIVFFFKSQAVREPYFYSESERTVLVNRELAIGQKLSVSYAGSVSNSGDITAVQCYFWNSGRAPIHNQDILKPIKLVLEAGSEILDVGVIRQSRPDIVDFHVVPDITEDGKRTNKASVSFRILEKGDGAALQVVYEGGPSAKVLFTGVVEGAEIKPVVSRGGRPLTTGSGLMIVGTAMVVLMPLFSVFQIRFALRMGVPRKVAVRGGLLLGAAGVVGIAIGLSMSYYSLSLLSPGSSAVPTVLLSR
jgi:hypothetical protein